MSSTGVGRAAATGLVLLWAGAAAYGFGVLLRYKNTPGETDGAPPGRWPAESRLVPAKGEATLVMFVHPHCPCTHASVSELARLMAHASGRLAARVVLVQPRGVEQGWDDTELRRRAAAIPGVTLGEDDGLVEAGRFHAMVSGFTLLYDAEGRLQFAGGITSARGHEGDSFGQRRILAALSGDTADRKDAPVFGCSLVGTPRAHEALHSRQEGS